MALVKQTSPMRETSMGLREGAAPVCVRCRERKPGDIYTLTPNGQPVCEACASTSDKAILKGLREDNALPEIDD